MSARRTGVIALVVGANLLLLGGGRWLDAGRPGSVAPLLSWDELAPDDWIYGIWTRVTKVDGREVHYPTPTEELARVLEARREIDARRHRADALRRLGDWKGAWAAMGSWAEASGGSGWAEAARWAASERHPPEAFAAFDRARRSLEGAPLRALWDEAIGWAEAHPGAADPLELRLELADAFPEDAVAFRELVAALRKAGQLGELSARVVESRALPQEERLLLRAELAAQSAGVEQAFLILDPEARSSQDDAFDKAYAGYVDRARASLPDDWRAKLEKDWDRETFARLCAYLQGHGRGAAAAELAAQMERRHAARLTRFDRALLCQLHESAGDLEQAFRMRLAAAAMGDDSEQEDDLAELARLAILAGAAALPVGRYRDEGMRLVARMDRTPGIWTGGLAFLLTGGSWSWELAELERAALPDRTFGVARALAAELERRDGRHAALPELWCRLAQRHLDRGEADVALATLRKVRFGEPDERESARRLATVAMRQVARPLEEEVEVYRQRLLHLWPTGGLAIEATEPALEPARGEESWQGKDGSWEEDEEPSEPDASAAASASYREVLDEALSRIDERDRSHQTSVRFVLAEMDRHPEDEDLWLDLAERLTTWGLDDELGPRYERAAARFEGPGVWQKLARWYARRRRVQDLDALARRLAATFRGSELFDRAEAGKLDLDLPVRPRPRAMERVMLVPYADLVRMEALERFPHSPRVVNEALSALARHRASVPANALAAPDVVRLDALAQARRAAVIYVDPSRRDDFLASKMSDGSLERFLEAVAKEPGDPVRDRLLLDGWARLSRFDLASPAADRLLASYPGDAGLVTEALQLHRSLSAIEEGHERSARAIADRHAPVLPDPATALTAVGELLHDRGRIDEALELWARIGKLDEHDAARVSELATLYWDYDHMAEALAVVEEARARMNEPWLLAFEAGVLREETHDLPGAIREYVATLHDPASDWSTTERASRRLAQLSGRATVRAAIDQAIGAVVPGQPAGEQEMLRLLQLATVTQEDLGYDDDWIDDEDMPRDPVGQEEREDERSAARELVVAGIEKSRAALLEKSIEMVRATTRSSFVDAVAQRRSDLASGNAAGDAALQTAILRKRSELEKTPDGRVRADCQLLAYLVDQEMAADADALAAELWPRVAALPDGAARMRAEVFRPWFLERRQGMEPAAAAWAELARSYPWSLGMLEDRQTFLIRSSRRPEARAALEEAADRAAPTHRIAFLSRVAEDAMTADPIDLELGRRSLDAMLASPGLSATDRRRAAALRVKLAIRAKEPGDVVALAASQARALPRDERAAAWAELARTTAGEGAPSPATHMWIEALKLEQDPGWLREACTTAERGDKLDVLQRFYEEQVKTSPRDVHGHLSLRDVQAYRGDAEGAIGSARAAVKVRPEQEESWRAAASLLERAGRAAEASDLVAGYARPRQSREDVAQWWSSLEAASDDAAGALAVERGTLEFWESLHPGEEAELVERRARAAMRLSMLGLGKEAWSLLAPDPGAGLAPLLEAQLGAEQLVTLAMGAGKLPELLDGKQGDGRWLMEAAGTIRSRGTQQDMERVEAMAQSRCSAGAPLQVWWPFATTAGVGAEVGVALARPYVAATPGPWQAAAPDTFLEVVGARMVGRASTGEWVLLAPPLEPLWVLELVDAGREDDLVAFLEPSLDALIVRSKGDDPIGENELVPVATWLVPEACRMLGAGLARKAELRARLEEAMASPSAAPRMWRLAGRAIALAPLLEALEPQTRSAWFQNVGAMPSGPGAATIAAASRTAAALVSGEPLEKGDPLLVKLRGPRDVGGAIKPGVSWRFDDLGGASLPVPLWGEAPREPWLAFESLARFRLAEPDAGLVPLESAALVSEGARVRLGMRLALASGQPDRALALDRAAPRSGVDLERLRVRLRALDESGAGIDATRREWEADIVRVQGRLDVEGYRQLSGLAFELALPLPEAVMAPATPIEAALFAHLVAERGPAVAARLKSEDSYTWKQELSNRLASEEKISADLFRYYVENVWAGTYSALLESWLDDMGGIWKATHAWLRDLDLASRPAVAKALLAYPETEPMAELLDEHPDWAGELGPWLDLARGEDAKAEERVRETMREPVESGVWGDEDEAPREVGRSLVLPPFKPRLDGDRAAARLQAALAPFRTAGAGRGARIEGELRAHAIDRIRKGLFSARIVALALDCSADAASRAGVLAEVDRAWVRGDVGSDRLPALVELLALHDPAAARRYLDRWSPSYGPDETCRHARVAMQLGLPAIAARELAAARVRGGWSIGEQLRGFRLFSLAVQTAGRAEAKEALALAPDWDAALALDEAALPARIAARPLDVFAIWRLLGSDGPLDRQTAAIARRSLAQRGLLHDDTRRLLALRDARAALAGGAPAARRAASRRLGTIDLPDLARDLEGSGVPRGVVDAIVGDVGLLAASAGEARMRDEALRILEERGSGEQRARVAGAKLDRHVGPVRPDGSGPYLPRDLDLPLVERILEGMEGRS